MRFIELHSIDNTRPFYLNIDNIERMEWVFKTQTKQTAYTAIETSYGHTVIQMMSEVISYCKESPEEILQKIAEAEQREHSFMNDWEREVDDQLGRLTVRKEDHSE